MKLRGLLFALLLAALVVTGVLRPVLFDGFRLHWTGVIVVLGAAAAACGFRARWSEDYLVGLLPVVLAVLYLQPQRVASDGIFYYAPLRSIVVDGDLDFENEYRVLGATAGYFQPTTTGRLPNNYSVGPAIVWTPFFLAAHGLAHLGLYRPTGFGYPYFTAVATGTALVGFLGVLWMFRLVNAYFPSRIALVSTVLIWLASFHIWYMVVEPSMSHAMAMASVSGYLLFTHAGVRGVKAFALLGALGGVVALMRWQNVLFLPVAVAVSWSVHGRPRLREWVAGAAAFVAVFSPQLWYWHALYGTALLVPQGGGYIDWSSPELEAVLFSSRHGLLSWAPVLWLGVFGFPAFARRAPVLAGSLFAATLAAWYVNASVFDWWAGASFGSRRFDAALPAFALGAAGTVQWMAPRIRRWPLVTASLLLVPFVVWNAVLMGVYFQGAIPPDGPASFRQAAADGVELIYRHTGYPPSWPGALTGEEPLAVYDLAGSHALAHNVDIRMGDTDALYLGRGWSLPVRGRGVTRRTLEAARGEVYVALREPWVYTITVEGEPGSTAELELNGRFLGEATLDATGRFAVSVPAEGFTRGVNQIAFKKKGGRPFEVSRIRFLRRGDP